MFVSVEMTKYALIRLRPFLLKSMKPKFLTPHSFSKGKTVCRNLVQFLNLVLLQEIFSRVTGLIPGILPKQILVQVISE